jgi:XisH protein
LTAHESADTIELVENIDNMPAKDRYHETVKNALIKDGWTITHDPLTLRLSPKKLYIDLGAEQLIAAERSHQKIAIEVKGFHRASDIKDLEDALGQFVLYATFLNRQEPDRLLYLAIPELVRQSVFEEEVGAILLEEELLRVVSFDPEQEEIVRWMT